MKVSIGSISSATLRTRDLLSAFTEELERLRPKTERDAYEIAILAEANALLESDTWDDEDEERATELVNEDLHDALDELAPPYVYFGTHEGDGSDFGFWPSFGSLEDDARGRDASVLKVDAGDEWPLQYQQRAEAQGYLIEFFADGEEDDVLVGGCTRESDQEGFYWRGKSAEDGVWRGPLQADDAEEAWRAVCELEGVNPELPAHIEFVMSVTDHGNVTLYDRNRNEVWSCV